MRNSIFAQLIILPNMGCNSYPLIRLDSLEFDYFNKKQYKKIEFHRKIFLSSVDVQMNCTVL